MKVGGNTPCVELRVDGHVYVLDAGTGIVALGNHLMRQTALREMSIILTHYHWDHISGLPFFVPAFVPGWKIDFYGPAGSAEDLEYHIAQQMKAPYFPVETETWLAEITYRTPAECTDLGAIKLSHFTMHHPGLTYAYRIEVAGKTIVYAPDNELGFISYSIDERKEEFDEHERLLLEEMKEEQKWRGLEFMSRADLLIHDAQYTPEDYARKRGWGHSCYLDTVALAIEAGVKELYLFSHDPNNDDAVLDELQRNAAKLARELKSNMPCTLAREGDCIDLDRI
jgi:phosphoribosyl 1,2-cyclic phosphodiesterase